MLSQEQNLIFQSYFTTAFLLELKNNEFLDSNFFEEMEFGSPWIKDEIVKIGIDNQGALLMALYSMLVIPRELIQDEFLYEYDEINKYLATVAKNTQSDYHSDTPIVNYLQHIRNAVAHSRVSFNPKVSVIFNDERQNYRTNQKEYFSTELPLIKLGEFLMKLQTIHLEYISKLQIAQKS